MQRQERLSESYLKARIARIYSETLACSIPAQIYSRVLDVDSAITYLEGQGHLHRDKKRDVLGWAHEYSPKDHYLAFVVPTLSRAINSRLKAFASSVN